MIDTLIAWYLDILKIHFVELLSTHNDWYHIRIVIADEQSLIPTLKIKLLFVNYCEVMFIVKLTISFIKPRNFLYDDSFFLNDRWKLVKEFLVHCPVYKKFTDAA